MLTKNSLRNLDTLFLLFYTKEKILSKNVLTLFNNTSKSPFYFLENGFFSVYMQLLSRTKKNLENVFLKSGFISILTNRTVSGFC